MLNQRCLVNAITFRFRRVHFWSEEKAPFAHSRYEHRAKRKAAWENATSGGIKVKVVVYRVVSRRSTFRCIYVYKRQVTCSGTRASYG